MADDRDQRRAESPQEWTEMQARYRDLEQLFHELEDKLDMLLDIALSTSEAGRQSTVSKINKRRREPSLILKSIRKANRESGNRHTE